MDLLIFIAFLIMSVLVIAGVWVPSIIAIKIYLVVITVVTFINLAADMNK